MQDISSKNKTKIQTQTSADRSIILLSLAHQRKNKQTKKQKLSTNLTLYKIHTNHWTKFRRAETKKKKEFNLLKGKNSTFLEAWEKETPKTIT